ncbi:efflux RND transporter periplasmic adaptor subunit [candidate division KSB1 bacterium]|nr:efflux RND transporter periplasmic adaptor subunit [candidate division KSB1 bacterium]
MKKQIIFIIISIFLFSCGSKDKQARLQELEARRDALDRKIEELRTEIRTTKESGQNGKIAYVNLDTVRTGMFKHYIQVQGTVESDNNISIPPQASGVVKKIYVKEGDKVSRGQLLAELDGAIYESNIAELENSLKLATTIFERRQRLWNKNIGSEIEYLQAKNNKEGLEKKLKTVKEQYKLTKLTAPINGTVDEIRIKEGEAASAGIGAIRIVKLSALKIKAKLSENYVSQVRTGDTVSVYIPTIDLKFKQVINAVAQVIDPQNRTFDVELKIHEVSNLIKPNMLAVLTINDYSNSHAITVPINILQKTGEDIFLFVANNKPDAEGEQWIAERRIVIPGKSQDDRFEIKKGLQAGEQVVVFGYQDLADGQTLKLSSN